MSAESQNAEYNHNRGQSKMRLSDCPYLVIRAQEIEIVKDDEHRA